MIIGESFAHIFVQYIQDQFGERASNFDYLDTGIQKLWNKQENLRT